MVNESINDTQCILLTSQISWRDITDDYVGVFPETMGGVLPENNQDT